MNREGILKMNTYLDWPCSAVAYPLYHMQMYEISLDSIFYR